MSVSGEKLNLLIMRDSGETKRYRVRRSLFYTTVVLFLLFPIIAGFVGWGAYILWQDNVLLKQKNLSLENINKENEFTVKRLTTLEALLEHDTNIEGRIAQNQFNLQDNVANNESKQGKAEEKNSAVKKVENEDTTKKITEQITEHGPDVEVDEAVLQDGPGHEEFPVVDVGVILVENVQSRLIAPRRLRISLDLRNPGETSLSGTVFCILSLASGDTVPLTLTPNNVGSYKILRWKKAVFFADIVQEHDLFNAQLIIEVKDSDKKLIYSNIFAIEQ